MKRRREKEKEVNFTFYSGTILPLAEAEERVAWQGHFSASEDNIVISVTLGIEILLRD